ncbi:MAG: hypothetical protein K2N51_01990 [Lachnospiraceae bacterium]|nr:hypothetical protein [Lachnospiraceae bacterium]
MIAKVIESIDKLADDIYTPDKANINQYYLELIEAIGAFLEEMVQRGYTVDLRDDLEQVQQAVTVKDYIRLSDILLYTIRKDFVNLQKDLKDM